MKPAFPSYQDFAECSLPRSSDAISSTTKDFDLRSRPSHAQSVRCAQFSGDGEIATDMAETSLANHLQVYKTKQWNNYRATEEPM